MAMNLLAAGFPLVVWNRTPIKTKPLAERGAKVAKGPAHVASEVDVVITMVSAPSAVESVILGPSGVLEGIRSGAIVVDMSTVSPTTSRKLAGALTTKQVEFLDAPVVGSRGPAKQGTLVILVGGLPGTLERMRPVFSAMGKTIIYAGGVGMGSALKLATNLMLAHLATGFAEGLLLVQRCGLDPRRFLDVLAASTFCSPWYETKGSTMLKRDFAAHFALSLMRKDLGLMNELAKELNLPLPVTELIERLFGEAQSTGKGNDDYSAILAHLEAGSPK